MPAKVRRITTPAERMMPIPMTSAHPAIRVPVATDPAVKRGSITRSITHLTAMLDATVAMA